MDDPVIEQLIIAATTRVFEELAGYAPFTAEHFYNWTKGLSGSQRPADYFLHPGAFIFLLMPWWVETGLTSSPDIAFQANLAYASINAFYYIRLTDNLMDGDKDVRAEIALLPVTTFLLTNCQ